MKKIVLFLFFGLSLSIFSQTKEIKVEKKKITESVKLNDFISDLPKDCKVLRFIFTINHNSALKEFMVNGEGIAKEILALIAAKEKGQWFFIEQLKTECMKSHSPNYKVIIQ